ncbi:MlaD family protein [Nocardia sp. NPDC058497]|uniref:MlaD family protein n=1 Tax=Nocardia sp. NPDC058497 TaxID=3346529 RepID=UPI00365AE63C
MNHSTGPHRWRAVAAVASVVALSATGCAFDPASVPVPGTGIDGTTYPVRIEFANALNLPARAKVMADGVRVGTVADVAVVDATTGGYVLVTTGIAESVVLRTDTVAQLRQNTVLGDIHIELTSTAGGQAPRLRPGGVIPRAQTKPATQIEDTLAGLSTLVHGGAITRFQDIVDQLNTVFPDNPAETRRIAQVIGADAQDLAANLHTADTLLDGMSQMVGTVDARKEQLAELLTEPGVAQASASVASIVNVVGVLGALGAVAHSLAWLAPLAASGDAAARAFVPLALTGRPLDLSAPSNLNALVSLIRDRIIPFVERGPKVNIVGARVTPGEDGPASTDEQVASIVQALRMIGAVR